MYNIELYNNYEYSRLFIMYMLFNLQSMITEIIVHIITESST